MTPNLTVCFEIFLIFLVFVTLDTVCDNIISVLINQRKQTLFVFTWND